MSDFTFVLSLFVHSSFEGGWCVLYRAQFCFWLVLLKAENKAFSLMPRKFSQCFRRFSCPLSTEISALKPGHGEERIQQSHNVPSIIKALMSSLWHLRNAAVTILVFRTSPPGVICFFQQWISGVCGHSGYSGRDFLSAVFSLCEDHTPSLSRWLGTGCSHVDSETWVCPAHAHTAGASASLKL